VGLAAGLPGAGRAAGGLAGVAARCVRAAGGMLVLAALVAELRAGGRAPVERDDTAVIEAETRLGACAAARDGAFTGFAGGADFAGFAGFAALAVRAAPAGFAAAPLAAWAGFPFGAAAGAAFLVVALARFAAAAARGEGFDAGRATVAPVAREGCFDVARPLAAAVDG
jgi:hypothetical protein